MQSTASSPDSATKNLVWVNDPSSSETLSGRVRLACLTCRRKKLKCSGDVPCRTCVSRHEACEGMAARKCRKDSIPSPKLQKPTLDGTSNVLIGTKLLEEFDNDPGSRTLSNEQRRSPRCRYQSSSSASVNADYNFQTSEPMRLFQSMINELGRQSATPSVADVSQFHHMENLCPSPSILGEQLDIVANRTLRAAAGPEESGDASGEASYLANVAKVRSLLSIAHTLEGQALELRQVVQAKIEGLLNDVRNSKYSSGETLECLNDSDMTSIS